MNLTSGVVLFAVTWFLTFYIVLMLRTRTQAEAGDIVPGTPAGAPAEENIGRSALIATGFALVIWGAMAAVILWGGITIEDLDFRGILEPKDSVETPSS
ncbi:DUF1467 family protein [Pseudomonas sp. GX19020]|uniref:DUF1467 family protein n=1 Tax=Pseudomonas sp. GX19020 TaxID=2942277 RepID=UPI002018F4E6|nr:DUF1467 family protein [Pseudomonas sp. GX19020]MCL4069273.1 DUF1467 family protein [Pseudomonas sp. GX19020]